MTILLFFISVKNFKNINMNKIIPKNFLTERLWKQCFLVKRHSTTDKDKDPKEEEVRVNREKGGKTKAESIQEESYFHKEEVEQLKELKKKIQKEKQPDGNK